MGAGGAALDIYGEWIELSKEISQCAKCGTACNKFVFGGEKNARIMVVLRKPSKAQFDAGDAYCGKDGEFLKEVFKLAQIENEGVFSTFLFQSTSGDSLAEQQCTENCIQFLRRQFKLVSPEIIVTVGEAVSKRLIGVGFNFKKDRAKPIGKGKVMFFAVSDPFTPFNKEQRDEFLHDILNVAEFCKTYPSYKFCNR